MSIYNHANESSTEESNSSVGLLSKIITALIVIVALVGLLLFTGII